MSRTGKGPDSSIFLDLRGAGRALRVTWHHEGPRDSDPDGQGLVVLSLWRHNVCAGSFRLAASEVPAMIDLLTRGLAASFDSLRTDTITIPVAPTDPLVDTA